MGLRGRIRRLDKLTRGVMVVVPQRDGTEARFPPEAGKEAFMNLMDRLGAGEDAPSEHPLIAAARNSSDPRWSRSFFATNDDKWTGPIPDLSGVDRRTGGCPSCGNKIIIGERQADGSVVWDGERPCGECGRLATESERVTQIVVVYDPPIAGAEDGPVRP